MMSVNGEILKSGAEMTPSSVDSLLGKTKKSAKVGKGLGDSELHEKAGKTNQF